MEKKNHSSDTCVQFNSNLNCSNDLFVFKLYEYRTCICTCMYTSIDMDLYAVW